MDLNSIADSTDWKDTRIPALVALESGLRCQICKDFYQSPVITSCCHTFCSLCIRRCLTTDSICPICRSRDEEARLRKNNAVEELLDAFTQIREKLLKIVKEPEKVEPEKLEIAGKRRREPDEEVITNELDESSKRTTRSSSRKVNSTRNTPIYQPVVDLVQDDEDYDPIQDDDDHEEDARSYDSPRKQSRAEIEDGLVECPICCKRIKATVINGHIDICLLGNNNTGHDNEDFLPPSRSKQTKSPSTSALRSSTTNTTYPATTTQPPPQPLLPVPYTPAQQQALRLPKLNYSLLNESKLRTKLSELGVKTIGTKAILEKRHTEWVNIWNANLDAKHPKRKTHLLAELDQLEREQGKSLGGGNPAKKEGFTGEAWVGKHKDEFNSLVEMARKKRKTVEEKKDEQEGEGQEVKSGGVVEHDIIQKDDERQQDHDDTTPSIADVNGMRHDDYDVTMGQ